MCITRKTVNCYIKVTAYVNDFSPEFITIYTFLKLRVWQHVCRTSIGWQLVSLHVQFPLCGAIDHVTIERPSHWKFISNAKFRMMIVCHSADVAEFCVRCIFSKRINWEPLRMILYSAISPPRININNKQAAGQMPRSKYVRSLIRNDRLGLWVGENC